MNYDKLKLFLRVQKVSMEVMEETAETLSAFIPKKQAERKRKVVFLTNNLLDEIALTPINDDLVRIKINRLEKAMGTKLPNGII